MRVVLEAPPRRPVPQLIPPAHPSPPAVPEGGLASGLLMTGWLVALKSSKRNCSLYRSRIDQFFISDESTLKLGGPCMRLRPLLPKVPASLIGTGAVLTDCFVPLARPPWRTL